jgi:hypothetical protein
MSDFLAWVDGFWRTEREGRFYWHVKIFREGARLVAHRAVGHERIDVTPFLLTT